jgi:hypothetical protein
VACLSSEERARAKPDNHSDVRVDGGRAQLGVGVRWSASNATLEV